MSAREKSYFMQGDPKCLRCHNSGGIFDKVPLDKVTPTDSGFASLNRSLEVAPIRTTGTDCITCHVQGTKVFAGPNFKPSPNRSGAMFQDRNFCNPVATAALHPSHSCVFCHVEAMDQKAMHSFGPQTTCTSCHSENIGGDQHHFFYWTRDYEEADRIPARIKKFHVFDSLKVTIFRDASSQKNKLRFSWKNDFAPHPQFLDSFKQYIFAITLSDAKGNPIRLPLLRAIGITPQVQLSGESELKDNPGICFKLGTGQQIVQTLDLPGDLAAKGDVGLDIFYKRSKQDDDSTKIKINSKTFQYRLNEP
jgi:hypothetical protein